MNRFLKSFIGLFVMLAIVVGFALPAMAAQVHFQITVYRNKGYTTGSGGYSQATTGITYQVMQAGSELAQVPIYSDAGLTAKTNPVTSTTFATDGKIDFYCDTATYTTIDIIVVDEVGGFTLFMDGITSNVKNCVIDEVPNKYHHGMIWYNASCTATDLKDDTDLKGYDTGIDFPVGTLIEDVYVRVITDTYASAAAMSVGLGGTMAGLLDLQLVDRQGMLKPVYLSDTTTVGSLLGDKGSDGEFYIHRPYYVVTAASLNYAFNSADDTEVGENVIGAGYIHYFFIPTHVQ